MLAKRNRGRQAGFCFERNDNQIRIDSFRPSWLATCNGFDQSFLRTIGEQFFEDVVSMTIFLLSISAILTSGVLSLIEDRARVLYHPDRVGLNGKIVIVLKPCGMRHYAEKTGNPQGEASNDPRTTLVSRIICKLCLDALPRMLALANTPQALLSGKGQ